MADRETIMRALRNAHAAGDTEAARRLAGMLRQLEPSAVQSPAGSRDNRPAPGPRPPIMNPQGRAMQDAVAGRGQAFSDYVEATRGFRMDTPQRAGVAAAPAPAADPAPNIPEGFVLDPQTGQYTTREWMANNMQPSRAGAAVAGAAHGLTLGGIDEGLGAVGALAGQGDFQRERARARLDAARRDFPGTALGGELAGAVALPVPGARAAAAMSGPGRIAASSGLGAAFGAVYGALTGEGGISDRAAGAATGAAVGGAAGAAIPAAVAGARNVAQHVQSGRAIDQAARQAPTTEALRQQASSLYSAARERGLIVQGDNFNDFARSLSRVARAEGADPDITSAAWGAVRRLEAAAKGASRRDISFREIDTLRKVATNASTSNNPADRRIAGMIVEGLDDYVARLVDGDLVQGSAAGLSRELSEARKLWRAMRTSETLERAVERARDQASGFENGIRIQFRQLLGNQKFARGLSSGEREAMRAVVRGTPVGNMLKRLSRMSFGSGAQTNFMGASLTTGMGAATGGALGGPVGAAVGAVVPGVVGSLAARGAERTTLRMADRARAVATGGGVALPSAPQMNALSQGMTQTLPGAVPAVDALRR